MLAHQTIFFPTQTMERKVETEISIDGGRKKKKKIMPLSFTKSIEKWKSKHKNTRKNEKEQNKIEE